MIADYCICADFVAQLQRSNRAKFDIEFLANPHFSHSDGLMRAGAVMMAQVSFDGHRLDVAGFRDLGKLAAASESGQARPVIALCSDVY